MNKIIFPALFLMSSIIVGCTVSPPVETGLPLAATPTPAVMPATLGEWEKVIVMAKKEGSVNVYTSTIPVPSHRPIMEAFKDKYGIQVEFILGRGVEIMERVVREQRAGVNRSDVYETGVPTHFMLKERGYLAGSLNLPETQDVSKVWINDTFIMDKEHYLFSYYEYTPGPVVNTNLVSPAEEPRSWFDLLEPKWKGKIMWDDPTVPGPGVKVLSFLKQYVGGIKYWEDLAKQEVVVVRDRTFLFDSIIRGRASIAVGVFTAAITRGLKDGAPIKALYVKEGNPGAGWTLSLIKDAPHPNAAKLFLNWFISKEGQLIFSKASEIPSFRKDVPQEHVNPQFRVTKDTKIQYWTVEDEERQAKDQILSAEYFKLRR